LIREIKPWILRHFQPLESYPDKIQRLPFYETFRTLWFRAGPVCRSRRFDLVSIEEVVEQQPDEYDLPALGSEYSNTFS
jgi:hypothetical protein